MDPIVERLRSQALLDSLPSDEIYALARSALIISLQPGDLLIEQGDPSHSCYLIVSGELEALAVDKDAGTVRRRGRFYPDDAIGDVDVLDGRPYSASVRAVQATELIEIPATTFRRLVGAHPALRERFLRYPAPPPARGLLFTFPDTRPDERIIEQRRKHWIILVRSLGVPLLAMLFVTGLLSLFILAFPGTFRNDSPLLLASLGVWGAMMVALLVWLVWRFVDWLNDYYIVTTHRVIHIEKVAFFFEERREAPIEKIQDVTYQMSSPIHEILGYGDVIISTAAQTNQVTFAYIPDPREIQRIILELQDKFNSRVKQRAQYEKRRVVERALGYRTEEPAEEAEIAQPAPQREGIGWIEQFFIYANPLVLREERPNRAIVWRKHWIVLLRQVGWALAYVVLISVGTLIGLRTLVARGPVAMSAGLGLAATLVAALFLIGIGWLFWVYDDWRNDVYVLTNDAVVDEEKLPLGFERQVRRAPLDTIQDISYEIPNPIFTILDVGNVLIQTASVEGQLTFDHIHRPRDVTLEIYERLRAREEAEQARREQQLDEAIAEMLALYDQIRRRDQK